MQTRIDPITNAWLANAVMPDSMQEYIQVAR